MPRFDVSGATGRATRTWSSFTAGQKAVTALALVGLLVGGVVFSRWASAPSYAPLFTKLSPTDASAIVDELAASGTPYELADGGATVMVPRESVYDVRLQMSGQGLPENDEGGYQLLDEQSMTASQFQQQVAYQRALEGELTKTIQSIDGVESAVVHLAIPEKDVFTKETDAPTASVLVATRPGTELEGQQVQAISNLVSSGVQGMKPEHVTIADAEGRVLSTDAAGGGAGGADGREDKTRAYEERVSSELQAMLDRVVGPGHSVVQLTADLDFDRASTTTETFTANRTNPQLSESTSEETFTGAGGPGVGGQLGSGILGPDNIEVPAGGADGQQGEYSKTVRSANPALDKVVEQRESAPGAVRKLNAAVLLDTTTAGAVDPAQVEALLVSALGIDAARGDTIEVTRMPFDQSAAEDAAAELEAAKEAEAAAARGNLLRTGGLVALVVLVLGYALIAGRRKKSAGGLSDDERVQLEALQAQLELEASERRELATVAVTPALEPAPPDPRAELVAAARGEVGEMVKAQPEEVAQLLRAWLADRRS